MKHLFLLPLFIHLIVILIIGLLTLRARMRSLKRGEAKISEVAANSDAWPRRVRQMGENFDSQFGLPMLWYTVTGLFIATQLVDIAAVAL